MFFESFQGLLGIEASGIDVLQGHFSRPVEGEIDVLILDFITQLLDLRFFELVVLGVVEYFPDMFFGISVFDVVVC